MATEIEPDIAQDLAGVLPEPIVASGEEVLIFLAMVKSTDSDTLSTALSVTWLERAIQLYRTLGAQIAALEAQQKLLKDVANDCMQAIGDLTRYECPAGVASYRAGYTKVSYDAKQLDTLCADDDKLKARLWKYRKETFTCGSLAIGEK